MNKFMNILVKTWAKIGEFEFKILWLLWFGLCMIIGIISMIPAALMDVIGHSKHPWEKQFGVVGVAYIVVWCIVMPLRIVGWNELELPRLGKTIEEFYQDIKKEFKNGL